MEVNVSASGGTCTLPQGRGYSVVYHDGELNHCPGCGRTHWYIGRVSAQCGFCETAIPLAAATSRGGGTHHRGGRSVSALDDPNS